MEGNQENQITVYAGENFRLPTSKIRANTDVRVTRPPSHCYIKMRADGGEPGWMLEVAGEHVVVLCCPTKTQQPSRVRKDENSHISVGCGETGSHYRKH